MLTNLHVKNLALIDEAEVNFGPGLNILTGETGAGKSILIGSINIALGQKMSREMIRKGQTSALVELVFQVDNPAVREKLKELDVETEDGQLIITRKYNDGRSISRLNGETCTAAKIREISSLLLDIHGQHEHQKLLYPENQLEILDAFGRKKIQGILRETEEAYALWQGVKRELRDYEVDDGEREREVSFLRFEIGEIEEAGLTAGEDEELEKTYRRMSNSRKIVETLNTVHQLTGNDGGAGDQTGRAVQELERVTDLDDGLAGLHASIVDIDNLLNDFNREAASYLEDFTFSEEEFYETERRLNRINDLKVKYGRTVEDILAALDERKEKLAHFENFEERRQELLDQEKKAREKLDDVCNRLTDARREAAGELSRQVIHELEDLNFLSIEFEISFRKNSSYAKNGNDTVEFLISTNPGESVKPLSRVVSGGELSRIMLAIKTLLADKDETESLIFDEIDTGISGRTAQKVSEKMAQIAGSHQVLCITHLAQIASMADHHYVITKQIEGDGTSSHIRELGENEIVDELARILGGAEITQAVIENAGEMKRLADRRKSEIGRA
uniref:DNA repair protein RecN n=1 Tax=Eubacterium cellulosolvens TaxID=29322 RepID=UPI00048575F1|nr:DNA repair protein RecN [[Eubacterium] cellulosolvens]